MKLMKSSKDKLITAIVYLLFFVYIIVQFQNVFMYFDDFGYASLNYAVSIDGISGTEYNFFDIIKFCMLHWKSWGGRVLYYGIEIILLHIGLNATRIAFSLIITLIIITIGKLVSKYFDVKEYYIAIIVSLLYGLFQINILQHGIYWFSASSAYVLPILPLLLTAIIYFSIKKSEKNNYIRCIKNIFMIICVFFAAFSQEQIALANISIISFIAIERFVNNKKIQKIDIVIFLTAIIGTMLLLLAPGNNKRLSTTNINGLTFKDYISNLGTIINSFFVDDTYLFIIILLICFLFINIYLLKNMDKKIVYRLLNNMFLIFNIIFLTLMIFYHNGLSSILMKYFNIKITLIILLIFIIISLIEVSFYYFQKKKMLILYLFYGGFISIGGMIVSPVLPGRMFIPLMFLLFALMCDILIEMMCCIPIKHKAIIIILPLTIVSLANVIDITSGYHKNSEYHNRNNFVLQDASDRIKGGEIIKSITLEKLWNEQYSGIVPYIEGNEWMTSLLNKYYKFPNDMEYNYLDSFRIDSIYPNAITIGETTDVDGNLNIGVTCNIINNNMMIVVNDKPLPTIIGSTFISASVPKEELENNFIKVNVIERNINKVTNDVIIPIN